MSAAKDKWKNLSGAITVSSIALSFGIIGVSYYSSPGYWEYRKERQRLSHERQMQELKQSSIANVSSKEDNGE